ncbi:MAG TPA: GNAT family N-acetyltransferase [Bacillota bacterium]|nr:GNAT family N-acetyltransferase [Bacillota bacterium]
MTNDEVLKIAMAQSAIDQNCKAEDFCSSENIVVSSLANEGARKYLTLPFFCNLVSYGNNIVASLNPELVELVDGYINTYSIEHCFEPPNIYVLNEGLEKRGLRVCFMAEYFLPDMSMLKSLPCQYEIRVLTPNEFKQFYLPQWSNALCEKRKELDMLAVGAFDEDKLIGLAGCSADCDTMWQIGIDVLPDYRKNGIASALTSRLAIEVVSQGKVPFYCAAWSNISSVRNAIKSGFKPAWVEMTVKSLAFIAHLNSMKQ